MKGFIPVISLLFTLTLVSCKKSTPKSVGVSIPVSSSKSITSFIFKAADNPALSSDAVGTITNDSILISIPYDISVSNLKPTIVHTGASISPGSGTVHDFSVIVGYKVTAADNSSNIYKVIIKSSIGGTVYVGSNDGKLYALDSDNGSLKWAFTTGGAINTASPTYYNGTVFICSADKYLYAVDAVTGVLKWKFLTAGNVSDATPALYNGNLYFAVSPGGGGGMYSINAQTGAVNWQRSFSYPASNLTIYNDRAYVGIFYGFSCYHIATGAGAQSFYNWICGSGNPLVLNGVAFLGTEGSVTRANNAITAAIIWNYSGGFNDNCLYSGPTVKNGFIYNGGAITGKFYAMDSATGVTRWTYPSSGLFSSPVVANNIVYAGNSDSYFYAFDATLGTLKWRFGDPGTRSVGANNGTVAGKAVYFGSYNKNVYCLNAISGAINWKFATGGTVYSGPCIVAYNQVVYHPGLSGEQQ
ncbi:MAG: PQQ-binding-like beta-propeller repeat protein [Ferruginibacter sp.]